MTDTLMTGWPHDILVVLWIFLPAGIANMAPVFAARLPLIRHRDMPMDFGRSFRGRRILGDHKTWRGLLAGIVAATVVLALQQQITGHSGGFGRLVGVAGYQDLPALIVGPLFALGALGGDALKSFFKRQWDITPGGTWFPFDQTDYIIGGALAVAPFIRFTLRQYVLLIVVWTAAVIITTHVGWLLKLKERPL